MDGGKIAEGKAWQTTDTYVMVVTALGSGVKRAMGRVYRLADSIYFCNSQYRTDIGDKVVRALPKLHRYGYVEGVEA